MAKWPLGALFVAKDVAAEQARFDARETVSAGPMFGKKTFPAEGAAAEREAAVLRDHGMSPATFGGFGKLVLGTRRHNLFISTTSLQRGNRTACASRLHCQPAVTRRYCSRK